MIALIDADIPIYKYAWAFQDNIEWSKETETEEPVWSWVVSKGWEQATIDFIHQVTKDAKCTSQLLIFSDTTNFRYSVLPTYKHNRKKPSKAPALQLKDPIRKLLQDTFEFKLELNLEADDMLGILASKYPKKYVLCTIDKDLDQIPCKHYNWNHKRNYKTNKESGDYMFYYQVLIGDSTDGYKGCPGIGPKRAERLLARCVTDEEYWATIVSAYQVKGLTEADALQQARVAKILQHSDYDFATKEVKLWLPNNKAKL